MKKRCNGRRNVRRHYRLTTGKKAEKVEFWNVVWKFGRKFEAKKSTYMM